MKSDQTDTIYYNWVFAFLQIFSLRLLIMRMCQQLQGHMQMTIANGERRLWHHRWQPMHAADRHTPLNILSC